MLINVVFFSLFASFLISASVILLPFLRNNISFYFLAIPSILIFVLAIALLGLISGKKIDKTLRKYLVITSVSAIVLFAGSVLHNVFYGLAVLAANISFLRVLMELVSGALFILTIFVAPFSFLFGAIKASLILLKKKK